MKRWILSAALIGAAIFSTSPAWADAISITGALTPFGTGVLGTSWVVTQGSASIGQTTGAQFSSPSGPPAGTSVLVTSGGGNIVQDITSLKWQGNTNYTLDLFIGVPTGQAAPPVITLSLLYNTSGNGVATDGLSGIDGTLNGVSFTDQNTFSLTAAPAGQWKEYVLNITTPSLVGQDSLGKNITVDLRADGSSNALVDWYVPAAVPGPIVGAGLPGLLAAFGALVWCRKRRVVA